MKFINDIIFKAVFGKEENSEILRYLINALLDYRGEERITEIQVLNPYIDREHVDDKLVVLDIKARDAGGRIYNIEVQINPPKSYVNRAVFYLSKLYSEQLMVGDQYTSIPKTIGISIIDDGIIFSQNGDIHNAFRFKNIKTNEELTDKIEIHFIEMDKFDKNKPVELGTRFEKWLHLLKFGELYEQDYSDLPEELKSEEGIEMAYEAFKKATSDDYVREVIRMREKAKIDRKFELLDAKEEGKLEGIHAVAKNMKTMGIDSAIISSSTGLTELEIKNLD